MLAWNDDRFSPICLDGPKMTVLKGNAFLHDARALPAQAARTAELEEPA